MNRTSRLALVALLFVAGGCAGAPGLTPSASVTTTTIGWEHYFKVDWGLEPGPADSRRVTGYLYNEYGRPATNVRVLAQALDTSGGVIGQRLAWVPGGVPPLSRTYFEVGPLPPADMYRVSVWAFDFLEGNGWAFW